MKIDISDAEIIKYSAKMFDISIATPLSSEIDTVELVYVMRRNGASGVDYR